MIMLLIELVVTVQRATSDQRSSVGFGEPALLFCGLARHARISFAGEGPRNQFIQICATAQFSAIAIYAVQQIRIDIDAYESAPTIGEATFIWPLGVAGIILLSHRLIAA
jgi:hypothetical protein